MFLDIKRVVSLLFAVSFLSSSALGFERQDQQLSNGWKFIKDDVKLDASTDQWQDVTVPHTWNTKSEDAHYKQNYSRGACWYSRSLDIPAAWQGKRFFLRFEAASLVSKTYLNGQLLGEHRGGFTAFCYELTPHLHFGGSNEIRVQVDNSHREDVPPLSGDFNVDGGIYRPVHLIVTDPICISPLNMASPGVYLTTRSVAASGAQVEVKTLVSNGSGFPSDVEVKTEIKDAVGKVVASGMEQVSVPVAETKEVVANITLPTPHLWQGRKDPYLYTAVISLVRANEVFDSIEQPLGIRTFAITEDKGFLLNGQPYPIHGVNRHQDWGSQGWVATPDNYKEDEQLILDMGTTAIRLAHYPQSDYWHNLCDHNGLFLWNEVSLVNQMQDTPEFKVNAEQQLRELILQRYNHPSVVFWGLFNELDDQKITPESLLLLQHLKSVIGELDSTRLVVAASNHHDRPFNTVPDHLCFNSYPGWYAGRVDELNIDIDKYYTEMGKRVGISEYGAGANTAQHLEGILIQSKASGPFHPEEWQSYVHERDWSHIKDNPKLWGAFIWVMFDFQVANRHEGSQDNLNDKGLVTQDRKIKKDAYFFYQANWTDKPMVHIVSGRMTPRQQAPTEVKVYSNCAKVELSLNGISLGAVSPDDIKVFRWPNVSLQPGKNRVKAIGITNQGKVTDACEWILGSTL
jgi:beta-galactosidase